MVLIVSVAISTGKRAANLNEGGERSLFGIGWMQEGGRHHGV